MVHDAGTRVWSNEMKFSGDIIKYPMVSLETFHSKESIYQSFPLSQMDCSSKHLSNAEKTLAAKC